MEPEPNLESLVTKIITINNAWKQASEELLDSHAGLATSLRDLKMSLQIQLLRHYPQKIYLVLDENAESEEALYSVRLRESVGGHWNAGHLPVRVAEEMLTSKELTQFVETVSAEES